MGRDNGFPAAEKKCDSDANFTHFLAAMPLEKCPLDKKF